MIESKTMNKPVIESKKVRKKFDRAFKERAVELWLNRGRAATEVAAPHKGKPKTPAYGARSTISANSATF
jgi:transposase-like protein